MAVEGDGAEHEGDDAGECFDCTSNCDNGQGGLTTGFRAIRRGTIKKKCSSQKGRIFAHLEGHCCSSWEPHYLPSEAALFLFALFLCVWLP
jgi:hypothetical protein